MVQQENLNSRICDGETDSMILDRFDENATLQEDGRGYMYAGVAPAPKYAEGSRQDQQADQIYRLWDCMLPSLQVSGFSGAFHDGHDPA